MSKTSLALLSLAGVILGAMLVVLLILVIYVIVAYNSLVSMNVAIDAAWAQVENQLQRRYELIPNLVNTAKGYAKHEREVFERVAEARAKLAGAKTTAEKINAANHMESALSRLLALRESYPTLKANETFIRLMDELAGTENRIAVERMRYNEKVQAYNGAIRRFPKNVIAQVFAFKEAPFFKVTEAEAKVAPKVGF